MEKIKITLKHKDGRQEEMEIEKQSSRTLKIELAPAIHDFATGITQKTGKTKTFYFDKVVMGKPNYVEN